MEAGHFIQEGQTHFKGVLRVVQAIHTDVVLEGGAGDRAKHGQLQSLGGGCAH